MTERADLEKVAAFRGQLMLLVNNTIDALKDDEASYAAIVGTLFGEACQGCKASGVPLEYAMRILGHIYGAKLGVIDATPNAGEAS